ncbi:MAG: YncE family protein [Bryobacteraceae bacterium]|jgi:DNA-binding beta-propeller fold protein YncE
MKKILILALVAGAVWAAEGYKIISKIKIGGEASWDYVAMDSVNRRLYVSHGASVEVVDPDAGKVVGVIGQLHGVHGIAIAADLNKGFITNRTSKSVTIFDLKTLAKLGEPAAGENPDAVCYESKTKRVFAINHNGADATAIDAKTGEVLKTFPTGSAGEFCQSDGAGKLYVNLEDSSELLEIDAAKMEVSRKMSLAPVEHPSGLAIDVKNKKLFSVGDNKMMAVVDIASFKVIATPAIGSGPDAAGFDSTLGLAFSSNGEGNVTIVKLVNGKYDAVDTVTTEARARTMTVDEKLHRIYLLTADYPPAAVGQKGRPTAAPDSFHVLVVGK